MNQFFLQSAEVEQKTESSGALCCFCNTKDKKVNNAFFNFYALNAQKMSNTYLISHIFGYFKKKGVRYTGHLLLYILTTLIYCLSLKELITRLTRCLKFITYKTTSDPLSKLVNFLLKNLVYLSTIADILSIPTSRLHSVFKLKQRELSYMLNPNIISVINDFVIESSINNNSKLVYLSTLIDKRQFCTFETSRKELEIKFNLKKSHLNTSFLQLEEHPFIKRHRCADTDKNTRHKDNHTFALKLLPLTFRKATIQSQILQIDTSNTDAQIIVSSLSIFNKLLKEYQSIEISREQLEYLNSVNKLAKNDTLYFEADLSIDNDFVNFKNYGNFITAPSLAQSFLHKPEYFYATQKAMAI